MACFCVSVSEEEKETDKLTRWSGVECSVGKDSSHPGRVFYLIQLRSTQQRRQGPSLGDRQTDKEPVVGSRIGR